MKFFQIFFISFESLKTNKLRTFLTILGVVVGIFSIIVIMTIITMLQSTIEEGLQFLSKNTFEIRKYPAVMSHGEWRKYRNRKDITLNDFYRLENSMRNVERMGAYLGAGGKIVKFGSNKTNPDTYVVGVTQGVYKTLNLEIESGREFLESEIRYSGHVCVLGHYIVDKIFNNIYPVGKEVRVDGQPYKVIGVLKKKPDIFGSTQDNYIVIPISTFESIYGKRHRSVSITVMSSSKENYLTSIEAAIGYMRTIRKVLPGKENDFEIFSNESVISQINDMTAGIKIGALVVSIIALIAAGVGIMNIMLVSVTERTREIGIRKAVGAKKSAILIQFLIEAIALSLIGGFLGILLGIIIGNFAGTFLHAAMVIPYDWVVIGLSMCVITGVTFGTYPAYKAANLDPIEALRYE